MSLYISGNKKYHKNAGYKLNQLKTENINFGKGTFILIVMKFKIDEKSFSSNLSITLKRFTGRIQYTCIVYFTIKKGFSKFQSS